MNGNQCCKLNKTQSEYVEILVNGKLKKGRKEMYPDIMSQVIFSALDDVRIRRKDEWKERRRQKIRGKQERMTNRNG